jgi:hypothetical protein
MMRGGDCETGLRQPEIEYRLTRVGVAVWCITGSVEAALGVVGDQRDAGRQIGKFHADPLLHSLTRIA